MMFRSDFNFDFACVYGCCSSARRQKLLIIRATLTRRRNISDARVRIGDASQFQKLIDRTAALLIAAFKLNGNTCSSWKYFWT